jgi:ribonuclease P protein component
VLQAARREAAELSEQVRFGFTATRKLGGAVVRNRAKRRLKAVVRQLALGLAEPGFDYVLIARAGALQRPFAALLDDFRRALLNVHRESAGAPEESGRTSRGLR